MQIRQRPEESVLLFSRDVKTNPGSMDKSISNSVPASWKAANVSALYNKKGDRTDKQNYRPISLLVFLANLWKQVQVPSQPICLICHNLGNSQQWAHKKGHSTRSFC